MSTLAWRAPSDVRIFVRRRTSYFTSMLLSSSSFLPKSGRLSKVISEYDWLLLVSRSDSSYVAFIVLHSTMASACVASPQPTNSHSIFDGLPNFSFGNCATALPPQARSAATNKTIRKKVFIAIFPFFSL